MHKKEFSLLFIFNFISQHWTDLLCFLFANCDSLALKQTIPGKRSKSTNFPLFFRKFLIKTWKNCPLFCIFFSRSIKFFLTLFSNGILAMVYHTMEMDGTLEKEMASEVLEFTHTLRLVWHLSDYYFSKFVVILANSNFARSWFVKFLKSNLGQAKKNCSQFGIFLVLFYKESFCCIVSMVCLWWVGLRV